MIDYDMHIHTKASDGLWESEKIVNEACRIGLKGIAITDHDTVDALFETGKLAFEKGIDFVPGIEISTDNNGFEVHILGYYIDYRSPELISFINEMQHKRENRAVQIVAKLQAMGLPINFDEVRMEAGPEAKSIGRPHIGRVLVKKGYFRDTGEVFKYLLSKGKPAYVPKQNASIPEAVNIIKAAHGIPVLAHPFIDTGFSRGRDFENFVSKAVEYGIKGIEVYHTMHSNEDEKYLLKTANKFNLAVTGGSDFHGTSGSEESCLGSKGINSDDFIKFKLI